MVCDQLAVQPHCWWNQPADGGRIFPQLISAGAFDQGNSERNCEIDAEREPSINLEGLPHCKSRSCSSSTEVAVLPVCAEERGAVTDLPGTRRQEGWNDRRGPNLNHEMIPRRPSHSSSCFTPLAALAALRFSFRLRLFSSLSVASTSSAFLILS